MLAERKSLEEKINSLHTKLEHFPEGKLICAKNGKNYKWYRSDGHQRMYIPKANRRLAERLAVKKYFSVQLEQAIQEKQAIDSYLKFHEKKTDSLEEMLADNSGYQELLIPHFQQLQHEDFEWMNSPYEKNTSHPEDLNIRCLSGNVVRSKSEAIIEMALFTNKIPFRYEQVLHFGEAILCPDFTILHPHTKKILYWEHFRLMDEKWYYEKACSKLHTYISNDILPNIQLIVTYETKEDPLTPEKVQRIIEQYLL